MLLLLLLRAWALSPPLTSKNQCPNVSYLNDPGGFALLKKKYGMNFPYMMNNQFSIFLLPFEHQDTVTLFFFFKIFSTTNLSNEHGQATTTDSLLAGIQRDIETSSLLGLG